MPLVLSLDWTPAEPLPAEYRARIPEALAIAEAACAPATLQQFAVCMAELMDWIEVFGVIPLPSGPQERRVRLAQVVAGYRKGLDDIPADLLAEAVRHVTGNAEYRVLPLAGDLRKIVAAELERRRHAVRRLTTAQRLARFEAPTDRRAKTPEDLEAFERGMQQIAATVASSPMGETAWRDTLPNETDAPPLRQQVREAYRAVQTAPRRRIPLPSERQAQETTAA